jgi:hypothetical protein
MSWETLSRELAAACPVPYPYARSLVNRAWLDVQRAHQWSFLWGECAIPTPSPISAGNATYSLGSPLVTGDALASAAWSAAALAFPPLTQRQFRVGTGGFYNIIAADFTVPAAAVLTLDRPWLDSPAQPVAGYLIIAVYYFAPCPDFIWWESLRDPYSGRTFNLTLTRDEVDRRDPQRYPGGLTCAAIPAAMNALPGPLLGYPRYELWPMPLTGYTLIGSYTRAGTIFTNALSGVSDTVPPALGEDIVAAKSAQYGYEWCQANLDKCPRGVDYKFNYGVALTRYDKLLRDYVLRDDEQTGRNIQQSQESSQRGDLPWLSGRAGVDYVPG